MQATSSDQKKAPNVAESLRPCIKVQAEIEGLDEEIRLRLDRAYDVKYRMRAHYVIGTELYKQMLADDEKIIQARAKCAEAVYRGQQMSEPSCLMPLDLWDARISERDCFQPVRANDSDGYLLNTGTCESEYREEVNRLEKIDQKR